MDSWEQIKEDARFAEKRFTFEQWRKLGMCVRIFGDNLHNEMMWDMLGEEVCWMGNRIKGMDGRKEVFAHVASRYVFYNSEMDEKGETVIRCDLTGAEEEALEKIGELYVVEKLTKKMCESVKIPCVEACREAWEGLLYKLLVFPHVYSRSAYSMNKAWFDVSERCSVVEIDEVNKIVYFIKEDDYKNVSVVKVRDDDVMTENVKWRRPVVYDLESLYTIRIGKEMMEEFGVQGGIVADNIERLRKEYSMYASVGG